MHFFAQISRSQSLLVALIAKEAPNKCRSKFIRETPPPGHALFLDFLTQANSLKMAFFNLINLFFAYGTVKYRSSNINGRNHFVHFGF